MRKLAWMIPLGAAIWIGMPATEGGEPGAAHLFQQRCAGCHTIPNPASRTDRAWLDQVNRTT